MKPSDRRRLNREIERARRIYSSELVELPREKWPFRPEHFTVPPSRVWCSRMYSLMLFVEGEGRERLSISIARIGESGSFQDGLTWDELHRLKGEAGFGDRWAVEVFPPESELVNVSNMRHLWLLDAPPPYAWQKEA